MANHKCIPIFLLFAICFSYCTGCRKNTLLPEDISIQSRGLFDERYQIEFKTIKPLDSLPVVVYSIEKNGEGVNDVVITISKKLPNSLPPNSHQATVTRKETNDYVFSIPLKVPDDYPVQFYLGDKKLSKVSTSPYQPEKPSSEKSQDEIPAE